MALILVIVPTTAGPLIIRKLGARPALPASCAFADGDFRPLPWSADYARLTAADGPLARLVPDVAKHSHELRLSGSFDAGRSWELPIVLAHLALAKGDSLTDDPAAAGRILFATGAVDLDLKIIPGDYALEAKLARCAELFASAPDAELDIRLPHGPGAEAALAVAQALAAGRGSARIVDRVQTDPDPHGAAASALPQGTARPPAKRTAPFIAAGGALAAAAVAWLLLGRAPPAPPPPSPIREAVVAPAAPAPPQETAIPIVVEELRPPAGGSCRQLLFGSAQPVAQAVARDKLALAPSRADPALCGLRFRVSPAGKAQYTLPPELLAAALAPVAGADGAQTLFLKQNLVQNIVYRVQITGEGLPAGLALTHEIRTSAP